MTCDACLKLREKAYSILANGSREVHVTTDFNYVMAGSVHIKYLAGTTYRRVPDAAANAIAKAGAGIISD